MKIDRLECYKKIRQTWEINPKTKVKQSKKKYNRNKEKQSFIKEQKNVQDDY